MIHAYYRILNAVDASSQTAPLPAIEEACTGLLQMLTHLAGVSLTLTLDFDPSWSRTEAKDRLRAVVGIHGPKRLARRLVRAFELSPLAPLCRVEQDPAPRGGRGRLKAVCDIVRRETQEQPVIPPEYRSPTAANPYLRRSFYAVSPLEPKLDNGWQDLDRHLNRLGRRAVMHAAFEHAETTGPRAAAARYKSDLNAVARGWSDEEDAERALHEYGDSSRAWTDQLRTRLRVPRAADFVQSTAALQERLSEPNLRFGLRVFAQGEGDAFAVAAQVARCSFEGSCWQLAIRSTDTAESTALFADCLAGRVVAGASSLESQSFGRPPLDLPLENVACLATPQELSGIFRLPASHDRWLDCMHLYPPHENRTSGIRLGDALNWQAPIFTDPHTSRSPFRIAKQALLYGGSIFGQPGSGKSSALQSLLSRAEIDFLLLELKKREWRGMVLEQIERGVDVRIFTPGNDRVSPYRLNPFELFPGETFESIQPWIHETLSAGLALDQPGPAVLQQAVDNCLREASLDKPPVLADVRREAGKVVTEMGYDTETRGNIRTMIDNRLHPLTAGTAGRVFQCRQSNPPIAELLAGRTLIEMDDMAEEHAAFLAFVLLRLIERYVRSQHHG